MGIASQQWGGYTKTEPQADPPTLAPMGSRCSLDNCRQPFYTQ